MYLHLPTLLALLSFLIPTIASSPIEARTCPTTIITDGNFESGTTPPTSGGTSWTVVAFLGSSSYSLTSPGSTLNNNAGGKYAFTASLYPGPYSPTSGETLQQTLHTCAGKNYSIIADLKFDAAVNNACSLKIEYPFQNGVGSVTTGSATPGLSPGVWSSTGGTFQAVGASSLLSVVFRCENGAHNLISVDNVRVKEFNGNAY